MIWIFCIFSGLFNIQGVRTFGFNNHGFGHGFSSGHSGGYGNKDGSIIINVLHNKVNKTQVCELQGGQCLTTNLNTCIGFVKFNCDNLGLCCFNVSHKVNHFVLSHVDGYGNDFGHGAGGQFLHPGLISGNGGHQLLGGGHGGHQLLGGGHQLLGGGHHQQNSGYGVHQQQHVPSYSNNQQQTHASSGYGVQQNSDLANPPSSSQHSSYSNQHLPSPYGVHQQSQQSGYGLHQQSGSSYGSHLGSRSRNKGLFAGFLHYDYPFGKRRKKRSTEKGWASVKGKFKRILGYLF